MSHSLGVRENGTFASDSEFAIGGWMTRLGISLAALVLALGFAGVAQADALHGFCVSPTPVCSDNGAITPVNSNLPVFGFGNAGGAVLGTDELAFFDPEQQGRFAEFFIHGKRKEWRAHQFHKHFCSRGFVQLDAVVERAA